MGEKKKPNPKRSKDKKRRNGLQEGYTTRDTPKKKYKCEVCGGWTNSYCKTCICKP